MAEACEEIDKDLEGFTAFNKWCHPCEIFEMYKNLDLLKMQRAIAHTALFTAARFGSRGSALVTAAGGSPLPAIDGAADHAVISAPHGVWCERVRPIPERELWFERAWALHTAKKEKRV